MWVRCRIMDMDMASVCCHGGKNFNNENTTGSTRGYFFLIYNSNL